MKIETEETRTNHEILSMVSHDIKSPLNGIIGFVKLMAEENDSESRNKMARHIEKAGEDILYLINNALTMAKIAAGQDKPELSRVPDIQSVFKDILHTFLLEARAKNISLELWTEKLFPSVYWDMERLRLHAFNNIISNALKFTPPNGKIRISVQLKENSVMIIIEDNGPGIPAEYQKIIFQPYSQVDGNSHLRNRQGHGLGLYNAYRFIASHGGTIQLDSNAAYTFVNENYFEQDHLPGARFIIQLPVFADIAVEDG